MVSFKAGALLALASLPQMAHGQTQAVTCIPQAQAQQLFLYTLPDMVTGVVNKCSPLLPNTAFLNRSGPLVASYRAKADAAWPQAKAAFLRMGGDEARKLPASDELLRPVVSALIGSMVSKDIKPDDCLVADALIESLAPLPPENIARVIVVLAMASQKPGRGGGFVICRD